MAGGRVRLTRARNKSSDKGGTLLPRPTIVLKSAGKEPESAPIFSADQKPRKRPFHKLQTVLIDLICGE